MQKLNFDDLSTELEDWAAICSASEIHGLISGLGSVALAGDVSLVKDIVLRHIEEEACEPHHYTAIQAMQESVLEQFESPEFTFAPLLPDDDEELSSRIRLLSEWSQGFLVGFGTGVKTEEVNFSQDAQEVLRDLVEIANVTDELDQEGSEDDEVAFAELEEYIRAAAMMLYSEFGVDQAVTDAKATDADPTKPQTYH